MLVGLLRKRNSNKKSELRPFGPSSDTSWPMYGSRSDDDSDEFAVVLFAVASL